MGTKSKVKLMGFIFGIKLPLANLYSTWKAGLLLFLTISVFFRFTSYTKNDTVF